MNRSVNEVIAILALVVACGACGGGKAKATGPAPQTVALPESTKAYPATRFIPAKPSYAIAAKSVRDAQRSIRDAIDGLGAIGGYDAARAGAELKAIFAIDPFDPDTLARIGVDLDGGIAMFSEGVNPTIVVRLASTANLQQWVDTLRGNGMSTESVLVDGVELFTTRAPPGTQLGTLAVSWAFVDDWCWVHIHLPGVPDDGTAWFAPSRKPGPPAWAADWTYARDTAGGEPAFLGFFDLKRIVAAVIPKAAEAQACAKLLDPVQRVAIAMDGDLKRVTAKLSVDIGAAAARVNAALLGHPEQWDAAAKSAALAVQWNLDLPVLKAWLAPCGRLVDIDWRSIESFGVRAARAMVHELDLDEPSGRGVVALDLTHDRFFAGQLDQIPLRRTLESKRRFGPHQGAQLSVPFGPKVDYVLTNQIALVGMGDGLLAQVVGSGKIVPGPLASFDIAPAAWPRETWLEAFELIDEDGWVFGRRFVQLMQRWQRGHLSLAVDGTRLVLAANGTRQ